jgi:ADP-ribose pyrophosphatase YjhB (NUDIX family)
MMQRIRAQSIVIREERILMIEVFFQGHDFFCLPGGGVEAGESFEQASLRELSEECGVQGRIIRQTSHQFYRSGDESVSFLVDIQDQEPVLGTEPEAEAAGEPQPMIGLHWLKLSEIPERDRAFLWAAGLLDADGCFSWVEAWGDDLSYPSGAALD